METKVYHPSCKTCLVLYSLLPKARNPTVDVLATFFAKAYEAISNCDHKLSESAEGVVEMSKNLIAIATLQQTEEKAKKVRQDAQLLKKRKAAPTLSTKIQSQKKAMDLLYDPLKSLVYLPGIKNSCWECNHDMLNISMLPREFKKKVSENRKENEAAVARYSELPSSAKPARSPKSKTVNVTVSCFCGDMFCYNDNDGGQCVKCQKDGPSFDNTGNCNCKYCICNCNASSQLKDVRYA
jgi:hypothetical protein